ncbi:unnamed protein product [Cuscuta europaea]|uniref:Uncharacterized protein n=1 Tax=Cuscuta europaea TaxID=41803 RepID=A0A9P1EK75_CUSEU|nr:unnamed protein product [Cuscuta europaea]
MACMTKEEGLLHLSPIHFGHTTQKGEGKSPTSHLHVQEPSSRLEVAQGRRKASISDEKLGKIEEFYQGIIDFSKNLGVAGKVAGAAGVFARKFQKSPEFKRRG